jgi:hypothetical protein
VNHRRGVQRSFEAIVAEQYGVIARRQALDIGLTRRQIERRLGSGAWVHVLPGVYRVAIISPSLRSRALAAALWSAPEGLVAVLTAGVFWRMDDVRTETVHLLVPDYRRPRAQGIVVHRTGDLLPADIARLGPIPVTSALRTAIDLASVLDVNALEVAIESALRRGLLTPGQLRWRTEALAGTGRPGSEKLRALLAKHGLGRSASTPEVELSQLLVDAGLGPPVRQYEVRANGRLVARSDLAYPDLRIAIEYDSDVWHSGTGQRHADAERRNRLRAVGWTVVEVTPDQLREPERLLQHLQMLLAA